MRAYLVYGGNMRAYLAGPMRGIPLFNFPAFHAAAARFRAAGYDVFNPAEQDEAEGFNPVTDQAEPTEYYMRRDLPEVCASDVLLLLPGWRNSGGALNEFAVAKMCGLKILMLTPDQAVP